MKLFIMKCHCVTFILPGVPAAMSPLGGASAADALLAPAFNAANPDPDPAGAHGHNLITFDGWAGPLSAPQDGLL
jgi:hypothetical protein